MACRNFDKTYSCCLLFIERRVHRERKRSGGTTGYAALFLPSLQSVQCHYRLNRGHEHDCNENALRNPVVELWSALSKKIGVSDKSKKTTHAQEQREDRPPARVLGNKDQSPKNDKQQRDVKEEKPGNSTRKPKQLPLFPVCRIYFMVYEKDRVDHIQP